MERSKAVRPPWPVGTAILCVVVLAASFMTWGTIADPSIRREPVKVHRVGRYRPTQFSYNVIRSNGSSASVATEDKGPISGTAWNTGFLIDDLFVPHWVVVLLLPVCLGLRLLERIFQPSVCLGLCWAVSGYGFLHVLNSLMYFTLHERPGFGVFLIAVCYALLLMGCLMEYVRIRRQRLLEEQAEIMRHLA